METVLWRDAPVQWQLAIEDDLRFLTGLDQAISTTPAAMRVKLLQLTDISERNVETHAREHKLSRAGARKLIEFAANYHLDWIFFNSWRLSDGWLNSQSRGRPLEIFHDTLACKMRKAVVERLAPDFRHAG